MKRLLFILPLLLLAACRQGAGNVELTDFDSLIVTPSYASGFRILGAPEHESTIIETFAPWQGADSNDVRRLLILRDGEAVPLGYRGPVLKGFPRNIVAMSTSHVAMLSMLGRTNLISGVSGKKFVYDPLMQARADSVAEIGYEGNIDYETLLGASPDVVILYGINGPSSLETRLDELGIPYIYIGEYVENHPLGKAEWIYALAELTGDAAKARQVFGGVERNYLALRDSALTFSDRPDVMINTPYGGIWYVPSVDSYVVRLINDAGGTYMPERTGVAPEGNASGTVDTEQAYAMMAQSDIWLHPGQASSLDQLADVCPQFTSTPPFRNGMVFNNNLRTTPDGGNDYFESGVVRPDLVLRDLITIFHPGEDCGPTVYHHRLK